MLRAIRALLLMLSAAVILTTSGCGGGEATALSGAKIKGSLIKDGKTYLPPQGNNVVIIFRGKAEDGKEIHSPASFNNANGTFTVPGPTGNGLPPGTYKV